MQKSLSQKLVSVVLYLILAISVVLLGFYYYQVTGAEFTSEKPTFEEQLAAYGGIVSVFISWAYVLIIVGVAAAIIPSIIRLVTQPKNAVKTVISLAVVAIIVLVAYSLSDGTPFTTDQIPGYEGDDNVPKVLKFADTMIFSVYFLLAGAIISIIYAEIAKVFK